MGNPTHKSIGRHHRRSSSSTQFQFTLSPTLALRNKNNGPSPYSKKHLFATVLFFSSVVCCVMVTFSQYQHQHQPYGQYPQSNDEMQLYEKQQQDKLSLLFLGTATAHTTAASVARIKPVPSGSSAMLSIRSTSSSVTMMAMTAGSRTLIEIGNIETTIDDEESSAPSNDQFQIDVSYLDDDYENGLLILRRAKDRIDDHDNNDIAKTVTTSCKAINSGHQKQQQNPIVRKAFTMMKNPIVASVVLVNVASMIGILPVGVAGFVPGLAVTLGLKAKWLARPILAVTKGSKGLMVVRKRLSKVAKLVTKVYKNRSKYSLLSDLTWYLPKNNDNGNEN